MFKKIMFKARDNPSVLELYICDEIVEMTLKFLMEQLEVCQKLLSGYLEIKLFILVRFYFVSDPRSSFKSSV
jgi:dynein heavy chain, axonemal